ncbi:MAG: glycosyltransferase family 4 protein [Methanotrichaceae archaeon]
MKILVIPTTDWTRHPIPNRLNFVFDILAEEHDVYVLHFNLKKFRDQEPRETKCKLVDAGGIDEEDPSRYYLLNFPQHLRKIREIINKEGIDVILSANILPSFMANFSGVPVVFDYLDHLEESASIYYPGSAIGKLVKKGVSLIVRYNIRHANSIITVTEEFRSFLGSIGGKDITVIPNGVDSKLLKPLPIEESKRKLGLKGKVIGYVGSLEHWVDLETVIEALPQLDVKLLIIGSGLFTDYGDKIKRLAEYLGVDDKVIFTGMIKYQDLSPYISAMDIGLNPLKKMKKNEETVGGKVFNYLACGRPVLSSRMVSLERLLGDEIYYYDDVESLVRQTNKILASVPDESKYRSIAERFDWSLIARSYEQVLKKAAGPRSFSKGP